MYLNYNERIHILISYCFINYINVNMKMPYVNHYIVFALGKYFRLNLVIFHTKISIFHYDNVLKLGSFKKIFLT